ncbi:MAG TPA: ABC transporter substrate-binding protein [Gemmatimonadales bacterium]|nr:ABC transporter substrate-binding protein [Gemmatimonadales bacterium]
MRVVSLFPAATEIVAALGAGGMVVGVSHECDYPPEVRALPRVTRTRIDAALSSGEIDRAVAAAKRAGVPTVDLDVELITRLRPDVIIGQSTCEVCAVGEVELARVVEALMPTPWVITLHAHTLDGVLADIRKVGEALELADDGAELIAGLQYRLRRVRDRARGSGDVGAQQAAAAARARVLVLEWLDPPYVAGHWVPELVEAAGGDHVAGAPGEPSHTRTWRELAALAPDVVVIALCGFDVARARQEFAAVTDRDAQALFNRRVEFLDGNAYTSRPGPRLVDAAEMLARLITR